ncbi:hydroxyethylthiazole kinase [Methanococcoides methylutens]|uniref:Bifunctional NAD(P)H-hydrate repair enzyme n=1 Tax=Methanococcoides methylutens TaxID=2226 RepID=A0A099T1J0_METMT|nr:bifunctional ADP-dependent NAD(P)H-hydrate dehydratase/NAD(P)H-hydrate epimerase [Methanococcoides methylutens]KGK99025.1 hydroxyethylthiazole kinase [Methanococcoides methylutens]
MRSITSSRMRAIDANCEYLGLKGLQLMENAGAAIACEVKERIGSGKVLFIAGRGNNGGDAFVAARHLASDPRIMVYVVLAGHSTRIRTDDARHNFNILKHCSIKGTLELTDASQLQKTGWIEDSDIIIDALLGTGISGKLRETESTMIDLINGSGKPVIAVDVPSGFDPDGGEIDKAVIADITLTFHEMKAGLTTSLAGEYTSEVKVVNIGVCEDAEKCVGAGDLKVLLRRRADSHKGNSGRILIVGGGPYSGAPALAAMAALRTGADIVTVAAPANVAETIASYSPNIIVRPLSSDILCEEDVEKIAELITSHDVVVIGMGLGRADRTKSAIAKIIPFCKKVIVDADGLYGIELPVPKDTTMIITPHAGEFRSLGGNGPDDVQAFSKENGLTVLLKGKEDTISNGERVAINSTGNAGMTVGGTGDVLAGITGALFAISSPIEAACCAAFINGVAGDLAFEEKGNGLLATDIIDRITDVMK